VSPPCPEVKAPAIAGAFLTAAPWAADALGAGSEYGLAGVAMATAGLGAVPFSLRTGEAPTAVSLAGLGGVAWGSWTAWACWSDAPTPGRVLLGVFLTAASVAAGAVVRWRTLGTPLERARLDLERARLAKASGGLPDASGDSPEDLRKTPEDVWEELPEVTWEPPLRTPDTCDPVDVGGGVVVPLVGGHVIMGGATGAGKSVFLADFIADLLPRRNLRITVIDPKGDALLGMLRNSRVRMVDPEDADAVMSEHLATMKRRGDLVRAAADAYTRNPVGDPPPDHWEPTEEEPWEVVIVDEFTDFGGTDTMEFIVEMARKSRSLGQTLMLATQTLDAALFKSEKAPSGGGPRSQFGTRVAGRVDNSAEAEKIFGERQAKVWQPHMMPGRGHVLVRSEDQREPVMRRVPYMDKATLAAWARRCSDGVPTAFIPAQRDGGRHLSLVPAAAPITQADTVLGWLEEHGPASAVSVSVATGVPQGSVRTVLKRLADQGCVSRTDGLWEAVTRP